MKMKIIIILALCFVDFIPGILNKKQANSEPTKNKGKWINKNTVKKAFQTNHKVKPVDAHDILSNKIHSKFRRSDTENKELNQMLLLDSSNGFQRAIQTDIDELNNPNIHEQTKKGDIPFAFFNNQKDYKNDSQRTLNDTYINVNEEKPENSSIFSNLFENYYNQGNQENENPIDLLSKTALHYSEFILNEMRYMAEIQQEKLITICKLSNDQDCNDTIKSPDVYSTKYNDTNFDIRDFSGLSNDRSNSENQKNNQSKYNTPYRCGEWSELGRCNDTCDGGVSMRSRDCFDENNTKTPDHEYISCSNPNCLHCSEWSKFSSCSKICGMGVKFRERTCYMKDGRKSQEKDEENCSFHPCQPECDSWSDWSECSKPCDTGVTIRTRNCSLSDGSTKTFYEHHSCNTQPCNKNVALSNKIIENSSTNSNTKNYVSLHEDDGCLSAHITFEKYQYNVYTIFDDTDEHNDVEYKNLVLFYGNYSCGYSGVLTGRQSAIKFYDDIFRNFDTSDLSVAFWIYPINNYMTTNNNKTVFSFNSKFYHFGKYSLVLNERNELIFTVEVDKSVFVGFVPKQLKYESWHHIGVTYIAKNNSMQVYINGDMIEINIFKYNVPVQSNENTYPTLIDMQFQGFGNDPSYNTSLSAVIDEIYVFKCPISMNEFKNIANTCTSRQTAHCPSPYHGLCQDIKESPDKETNTQTTPFQKIVTPLNIS